MLDASKPLSDQALALIPKTATYAAVSSLNFDGLIPALRQMAAAIDPQAPQQIDQGLGMAKAATAVDIENDLLKPLGEEWVLYYDPANGAGGNVLGVTLVNRCDDAAKIDRSLSTLELFIGNMITGQMGGDMKIEFRTTKAGSLTVHYLAIPGIAPAWAVQDGNLYLGLFPQTVAAAAAHVSQKRPTILENEQFVSLRRRLGAQKITGVSFANLPQTAGYSYGTLLLMSRIFQGMGDMGGFNLPPMLIPPLDQLQQHIAPAGSITWSDERGIHHHALTPFPGASVLATDTNALVGQQALALSFLLPALSSGRESANRVKCASNLRQIGQGLMLYANDHKGNYPADLGRLVTDAELEWETFICPSAIGDEPPNNIRQKPDEIAKWVNQHSQYIYIGATMNGNLPADRIVAYEKEDNHEKEGMNILFNDGHVEWYKMSDAQRLIQQQPRPKK